MKRLLNVRAAILLALALALVATACNGDDGGSSAAATTTAPAAAVTTAVPTAPSSTASTAARPPLDSTIKTGIAKRLPADIVGNPKASCPQSRQPGSNRWIVSLLEDGTTSHCGQWVCVELNNGKRGCGQVGEAFTEKTTTIMLSPELADYVGLTSAMGVGTVTWNFMTGLPNPPDANAHWLDVVNPIGG